MWQLKEGGASGHCFHTREEENTSRLAARVGGANGARGAEGPLSPHDLLQTMRAGEGAE